MKSDYHPLVIRICFLNSIIVNEEVNKYLAQRGRTMLSLNEPIQDEDETAA